MKTAFFLVQFIISYLCSYCDVNVSIDCTTNPNACVVSYTPVKTGSGQTIQQMAAAKADCISNKQCCYFQYTQNADSIVKWNCMPTHMNIVKYTFMTNNQLTQIKTAANAALAAYGQVYEQATLNSQLSYDNSFWEPYRNEYCTVQTPPAGASYVLNDCQCGTGTDDTYLFGNNFKFKIIFSIILIFINSI